TANGLRFTKRSKFGASNMACLRVRIPYPVTGLDLTDTRATLEGLPQAPADPLDMFPRAAFVKREHLSCWLDPISCHDTPTVGGPNGIPRTWAAPSGTAPAPFQRLALSTASGSSVSAVSSAR